MAAAVDVSVAVTVEVAELVRMKHSMLVAEEQKQVRLLEGR